MPSRKSKSTLLPAWKPTEEPTKRKKRTKKIRTNGINTQDVDTSEASSEDESDEEATVVSEKKVPTRIKFDNESDARMNNHGQDQLPGQAQNKAMSDATTRHSKKRRRNQGTINEPVASERAEALASSAAATLMSEDSSQSDISSDEDEQMSDEDIDSEDGDEEEEEDTLSATSAETEDEEVGEAHHHKNDEDVTDDAVGAPAGTVSSVPDTPSSAFSDFYLRTVTAELADSLEKLRKASDFKDASLGILVHALQQGVGCFTEQERKRFTRS